MPTKQSKIIDDLLLRCAAALCENPGLDMVGLARETGISRPKLYRYFSSRDELINALALKSIQDIEEACEGIFDDVKSHKEAFSRLVYAVVPLGTRFHFLNFELKSFENEEIKKEVDRQNAEMTEMVEEAKKDRELRSDIPTPWILGFFDAMIFMAWSQAAEGTIARNEAPKLAFETFWRGVGR